ncbi:DNA-binding Lrp family transcriptional regulator [Planktotalea frisia]|uniref:DNA-binding transcriptional regulator AsnC n=1 Tax=Planktotalea frisia TaxID=696762 RepID=A0A1L9NYZ4_9RHOB|nr:Lrp/AsnC family transcriptional regulator [Planktotalea frisia]OJI94461.1 DNA-binding transcriptional regulator AsnC [Planktotalea frisia]PZX31005.1 DNA-binding Lrp family transcriptional regulator [Planktotalea frisia]
MSELNTTDRKLLAILRQNARASITTIAQQLGVSRATVQASLGRLLQSNVIQRFTIEVDVSAGVDLIKAVMTIEVQGNLTSSVVKALKKMPEIVSLHSTNGAWDLVAQIETTSLPEFDGLLRRTREITGILNSETSILLNTAK